MNIPQKTIKIGIVILCSLNRRNLLPKWVYHLDWLSDDADIISLELLNNFKTYEQTTTNN